MPIRASPAPRLATSSSSGRQATIRLHLGRKASGKSFRAKRDVELERGRPVSVWDPRYEWAGPRAADAPRRPRAVVYDPRAFLAAAARGAPIPEVVVWQGGTFSLFAAWARRRGGLVVIDEAQLVGGRAGQAPGFLELVTTCRHTGASLLLCAQRAATLDPNLRAQVDEVRAWRTTEPRDVAWLAEAYGSDFADSLATLSGHEYREWRG